MKIFGADEILPGFFVGDFSSCDAARKAGVFTSLCVNDTPCEVPDCRHIRLTDPYDMPMISQEAACSAVRWIVDRWEVHAHIVLVHCGAGMERSPLITALYISWRLGIPLGEAYGWVMQRRALAAIRTAWIPKGFSWSDLDKEFPR